MSSWQEIEARAAAGGKITRAELSEAIEKGGSRTADESEHLFLACPEWVAEREALEEATRKKERHYLEEETPLREELHRLGYPVKWVWDFVNAKENYYLSAIPTLIDHLNRQYNDEIREGIVRALAMKEARGVAGEAIIKVLGESGLSHQLRWALANTLTTVADRSNRDDIKAILATETDKGVAGRLARALKTAAKP